jgi:hypothetical protein
MPLATLKFAPGIVKDDTSYSSEGRWIDSDKIRFWNGKPEKLKGWQKLTQNQFSGSCRGLIQWRDNDDNALMAVGTHTHLYILKGGVLYDVTPVIQSGNLSNAFDVTNGSTVVTVTSAAHGMVDGNRIVLGAASFNGVSWAANTEFQITFINTNSYSFDAALPLTTGATPSGAATSTATGVGGTVSYEYLLNPGQQSSVFDYGWGVGTWNTARTGGGWNVPSNAQGIEVDARTWAFDIFGEDLVASVIGQTLIQWDASAGVGNRAFLINDAYTGDAATPNTTRGVIVSTPDRHLVALGADDPLTVAFASQETTNTWTSAATNTAGSQRLTGGSRIIGARRTRGQILIWTDTSLHSMTFRGPPYTFGFRELATGCGLGGPLAAVEVGGIVYWMGINQFFAFDGSVRPLIGPVNNFVFEDLNSVQVEKVVAGLDKEHNEVFWFYPQENTNENNRYVKYNYRENVWDVGSMPRTAWTDASTFPNNIGAGTNGYLYSHEIGEDDDGAAMESYIESADMDIGDGQEVMFINRALPDLIVDGTADITFSTRKDAMSSFTSKGPFPITSSTTKINPRVRGRQLSIKVESDTVGTSWRLGHTRVDMQPDGER